MHYAQNLIHYATYILLCVAENDYVNTVTIDVSLAKKSTLNINRVSAIFHIIADYWAQVV